MAFDDEGQAKAIAAEWEIDPELLQEAQWALESNDNNDGVTVSYFVRFNRDTDRDLLDRLGVRPGEFYREVSLTLSMTKSRTLETRMMASSLLTSPCRT